jgi:wobble nucleotide-excising tRNase
MSKSLTQIAQQLKDANKKVQLIYAFNGTGKTRLSVVFKNLVKKKTNLKVNGVRLKVNGGALSLNVRKTLYYNAFTEDLFYWDNDLSRDAEPRLKIQPNSYTNWLLTLLKDLGQDGNIVKYFQRYTSNKLTPLFSEDFAEVSFSLERGNNEQSGQIKISKGEESNFIWSVFYALLDQVVAVLNVVEPSDRETDQFNQLEYVFIDDPVSSLDDSHLIQVAVDLADLIKSNESDVKFVITTHNPLFFNVLCNEFGSNDKNDRYSWQSKWFSKSRLEKNEDGSFDLLEQPNDSPFAYHLHLISQLQEVIKSGQIEKYHFNLLRNIFEKTATFLGYKKWEHLLPKTNDGLPDPYVKRIVNFGSHSKHAGDEVGPLKPEEKKILERLVKHVIDNHQFWKPQTELKA